MPIGRRWHPRSSRHCLLLLAASHWLLLRSWARRQNGLPPKVRWRTRKYRTHKVTKDIRFTNSTRNIRRNTKKNSHPKVRLSKSAGMNSKRTQSKQKNRPRKLKKANLLKSQKLKFPNWSQKKYQRKYQGQRLKRKSPCKWSTKQSALTMETKPISITGLSQLRTSMCKYFCLKGQNPGNLSSPLNPNTSRFRLRGWSSQF